MSLVVSGSDNRTRSVRFPPASESFLRVVDDLIGDRVVFLLNRARRGARSAGISQRTRGLGRTERTAVRHRFARRLYAHLTAAHGLRNDRARGDRAAEASHF